MSIPRIICVLILISIQGYSQSPIAESIDWFDSFFQHPHKGLSESTLIDLRKKILTATSEGDPERIASLRKELGLVQVSRLTFYDSAYLNLFTALQIEDSLGLKEEKITTYLGLAKVFEEIGEYEKGIEMLDNAIETSRPFGDDNVLVYLLNFQGQLYTLNGARDLAADCYNVVLNKSKDLSSKLPQAEALFNLGQLHREAREYAKALESHKQGLEIFRELKEKSSEARALNEIGEVYQHLKNPEKALANFVIALQLRTVLKEERGLAETYNNIGILYFNQKNYARSIANLQLALQNASTSQWAEESAISYDYLSHCFKSIGDFKRALEYKELSTQMVDMAQAERMEHALSDQQNRYEISKKETRIRELQIAQKERELTIKTQRKVQSFLTVLVGFGVIIVLLILYMYLIKRRANISLEAAHAKVHRQNQELQNLNATKDKFFSIISHDLKGPLNSFMSFSRMLINHTDSLTKEEIQMLAREIDKNLKNLLSLLENLLEWSRSQTGNIEFNPEAVDLFELIRQNGELLATQARNKNINLTFETGVGCFVNVHKQSINTVIRNLISNAIKFTPAGGTVDVSLQQTNGNVRLSVKDTGVGMSEDVIGKLFRIDTKYTTQGTSNEKGTGLGLILCKDFVQKNGGTIGVTSSPGQGSTFYFTLKMQPVSTAVPEPVV